MFTGFITHLGMVETNNEYLTICLTHLIDDLQLGASIAINGTCLTVIKHHADSLSFAVSPETKAVTTLGSLQIGDWVNIECAMAIGDRFHGHFVTGHVEAVTEVLALNNNDGFQELIVGDFCDEQLKYLLPKGSIALDGVSLTINQVRGNSISIMLIPHTLTNTNLGKKPIGAKLNVEFDYFTRVIVEKLASVLNYNIMAPAT